MARRLVSYPLGWILLAGCVLAGALPLSAAGGRWVPVGPDVSSVRALAVTSSGLAYAGTLEGGVFASSDGGSRWSRLPLTQQVAAVAEVEVDPRDPRVVYARTQSGIFRSREGGAWKPVGPFGGLGAYDGLAFAPSDPDRLYVFAGQTLSVSRDQGATWQGVDGVASNLRVLRVDPRRADVLYAGTAGAVFKTTDGGHSWRFGVGPAGTNGPVDVYSLAIDPRHPDVQYAGTRGLGKGIWKSVDGGVTWTVVFALSGLEDSVLGLAVDPVQTSRIYAAVNRYAPIYNAPPVGEVWRSENAGVTWTRLLTTTAILSLAIDPANPRALYAGCEQLGVLKSADRGITWHPARHGIQALTAYDVVVDPVQPGSLWVAAPALSWFTSDFPGIYTYPGIFHTANAGGAWVSAGASIGFPPSGIARIVVDPVRPGRVWAFGLDDFLRSVDGGVSWQEVGAEIRQLSISVLAIDPAAPDRMYLAGSRREFFGEEGVTDFPVVWRSLDGGGSWADLGGNFGGSPEERDQMYALAIQPVRPDTLYAGGTTGFYRSRDGGNRWVKLGAGLPAVYGPIVVDPFAPTTLYTIASSLQNPVFKSTDAGASWPPTSLAALPFVFTDLAADPHRPGTLYAAGYLGVFVTADGGATWQPLNAGLPPDSPVYALAVDARGRLYAGVKGAGVFSLTR